MQQPRQPTLLSAVCEFAALVTHILMRPIVAFETIISLCKKNTVCRLTWLQVTGQTHSHLVSMLRESAIYHGRFLPDTTTPFFGLTHAIVGVKEGNRVRFLLECGIDKDALRRISQIARTEHESLCVFRVGMWLVPHIHRNSWVDFDLIRNHLEAVFNTAHRVRVIGVRAHRMFARATGHKHARVDIDATHRHDMEIVPANWHLFHALF